MVRLTYAWLVVALCLLSGCGNITGKPLPMVGNNDPTWALVPDHLDYGTLRP